MNKLWERLDKFIEGLESLAVNATVIPIITSSLVVIFTALNGFNNLFKNNFGLFIILLAITGLAFQLLKFRIDKSKELFHIEALKYGEVLKELEKLKNNQKIAYKELYKTNFLTGSLHQAMFLAKALLDSKDSKQNFRQTIKDIIDYLYMNLDYNKNEREFITIAIYLYNEKDNTLEDYYSVKPGPMGKEEKGRTWDITDTAHLCLVYNGRQEYIFSDIHNEIRPKPRQSKEDDYLYYNSAISIPILGDNLKIRGVFCLTSSNKYAFASEDPENEIKQKIYNIQNDCIYAISNVVGTLFLKTYGQQNSEPLQKIVEEIQPKSLIESNI